MQGSPQSLRALATAFELLCLLKSRLVKKTKFVVSLGYLTPSESCRGILWETAATVWRARLGFSFRFVAAELRVPHQTVAGCSLVMTVSLRVDLLLLILLIWQDVACEYTFDSKLDHKIHKEHPIWHVHPAVTKKSMQTIITNTGRKKDEANVPVSTCSMPASSSSTRRPRSPGARIDQKMYVSMTTRRVRSTRRKTFVCKIGSALSLATNKNRFGVRKSILPCGGFLVYL